MVFVFVAFLEYFSHTLDVRRQQQTFRFFARVSKHLDQRGLVNNLLLPNFGRPLLLQQLLLLIKFLFDLLLGLYSSSIQQYFKGWRDLYDFAMFCKWLLLLFLLGRCFLNISATYSHGSELSFLLAIQPNVVPPTSFVFSLEEQVEEFWPQQTATLFAISILDFRFQVRFLASQSIEQFSVSSQLFNQLAFKYITFAH